MKRFATHLLVIAVAGLGACNKPPAEDCRKAIVHMEELLGTSNTGQAAVDIQGEVRRCRGGSSKEAVACAINAATLDQLKACGFMNTKPKP